MGNPGYYISGVFRFGDYLGIAILPILIFTTY